MNSFPAPPAIIHKLFINRKPVKYLVRLKVIEGAHNTIVCTHTAPFVSKWKSSLCFFHTFLKKFNVNHKCIGEDNAQGKKALLKMRRLYLNLLEDLCIIVIILKRLTICDLST